MNTASYKLRDLHYLLKNALGNIPIKQRTDRISLNLPIKDYSFIESDAPLGLTTADYFEYLPKYAELTGLVTKHKDYNKMQDILQWFADNEDNLESLDADNDGDVDVDKTDVGVDKTDVGNIAKSIAAYDVGRTFDDD